MKRMNWSYVDLMSLPAGYEPRLYHMLTEESKAHARAEARRARR
jgi:hypothetical protein